VSGTKKGKKMSGDYGTLRLWSNVLNAVGIAGVIFVSIGVILASIGADSLWQLLAILLIGGPIAALFASWPIALGQALDALADVAEYARDQQAIPSQRLSEGERVPSD
jgi:flagellar motor component MotA